MIDKVCCISHEIRCTVLLLEKILPGKKLCFYMWIIFFLFAYTSWYRNCGETTVVMSKRNLGMTSAAVLFGWLGIGIFVTSISTMEGKFLLLYFYELKIIVTGIRLLSISVQLKGLFGKSIYSTFLLLETISYKS